MPEKLSCHIVKDLLPLYLDELVSEETAAEIEEHLKTCADCQTQYDRMHTSLLDKQASQKAEARKEINYLRKVKKHTIRNFFLGTALTLFVCALLLALKLFVIGSPSEEYAITYLNVSDDTVHLGGIFTNSASVYSRYKLKKTDEGERLVIYSCLASSLNRSGAFNLEIPREKISGTLSVKENTVAVDGTLVSSLANRLYDARNPYIGDASANGRLAQTLGIANELGNFTNELQTSAQPYGWTLRFSDSAGNSAVFDEKMKGFACVLLALTDNLGEVHWEYTIELSDKAVTRTRTVTTDDCAAFLGAPVKQFGDSPQKVQELLELVQEQFGIYFRQL